MATSAPLLLGIGGSGCADRPPADTREPLTIAEAEQDLRIDGYEHDLVPVSWLGVARDGTIALVQMQDQSVRFFDSRGNSLGSVGGNGEGPGEFRRPVRGGWIADTLWISDPQLHRVTLIAPGPAFARTLPPLSAAQPKPADAGRLPVFSFVFPHAVYPGDTLLIVALGSAGDPLAEAIRGTALVRVSKDGVIDRMVLETPPNEGSITVRFDRGIAGVRVPFFARPDWTVSPDGSRIATVSTDVAAGTFLVSAYSAAGDQIFSRAYPFEGAPLPSAVADSALQVQIDRTSIPEVRRVLETDVKDRIPPIYPPVETIVIGSDDRIWIGLRAGDEWRRWLVLGADGEPQGEVVLPRNVTVHVANATHLWGLERDEVDVQSVVRYRIAGQRSAGSQPMSGGVARVAPIGLPAGDDPRGPHEPAGMHDRRLTSARSGKNAREALER